MVKNCCVKKCPSKDQKLDSKVSLHLFPTNDPDLLQRWIDFTGYGRTWKPTKYASVCSLHFGPDDFRLNTRLRCLKSNAAPSIKFDEETPSRDHDMAPNVCRLCACAFKSHLKPIFGDDDTVCADRIRKYLQLTVSLEDALPHTMCIDCDKKLHQCQEFIDQVDRAQTHLMKTLKKDLDEDASCIINLQRMIGTSQNNTSSDGTKNTLQENNTCQETSFDINNDNKLNVGNSLNTFFPNVQSLEKYLSLQTKGSPNTRNISEKINNVESPYQSVENSPLVKSSHESITNNTDFILKNNPNNIQSMVNHNPVNTNLKVINLKLSNFRSNDKILKCYILPRLKTTVRNDNSSFLIHGKNKKDTLIDTNVNNNEDINRNLNEDNDCGIAKKTPSATVERKKNLDVKIIEDYSTIGNSSNIFVPTQKLSNECTSNKFQICETNVNTTLNETNHLLGKIFTIPSHQQLSESFTRSKNIIVSNINKSLTIPSLDNCILDPNDRHNKLSNIDHIVPPETHLKQKNSKTCLKNYSTKNNKCSQLSTRSEIKKTTKVSKNIVQSFAKYGYAKCQHCKNKFISKWALNNHVKYICKLSPR